MPDLVESSAPRSLSASCTLDDAGREMWDAIVVGAGPSGALAARQLASAGVSLLLVDKADFPRAKVCGCYLNGSALATLAAAGLGGLTDRLNAPGVLRVRFGMNHRTAEVGLPRGAALSRQRFDLELVREAIEAGAQFLPHTEAKVGPAAGGCREVHLRNGSNVAIARTKVVVVADGVGGQSLKNCRDIQYKVATQSLVGTAAITDCLPESYVPGTIHMAVGRAGYVGALQIEDGRLDVAAAFAPSQLKHAGPGELARATVEQSGLPALHGLDQLRWQGTPPLSRAPTRPSARRLFLIGDASGYVEPFTGEGIAWALSSACLAVPFVLDSIAQDSEDLHRAWAQEHRRLFEPRQRLCRWLTRSLRRPWLAAISIAALRRMPAMATPVVRWLNRSPCQRRT